jgi:hypothetical protein
VKPCCACPLTKQKRDDCFFNSANGDVECRDLINAHRQYVPRSVEAHLGVWHLLGLKFSVGEMCLYRLKKRMDCAYDEIVMAGNCDQKKT